MDEHFPRPASQLINFVGPPFTWLQAFPGHQPLLFQSEEMRADRVPGQAEFGGESGHGLNLVPKKHEYLGAPGTESAGGR